MPPDASTAVSALETLRLGLYLLLNVIAIILCAVYSSQAHTHINVWSLTRDLFNFPDLKLHEEKLGYGAAIGRAVWGVVGIAAAFCGPTWTLFVIGILGLAFEIPLGTVTDDNFGYLVSLGPGLIYPVTSGTCTNGMLSADQVGFYTTYASLTGGDPVVVCKEFALEGMLLQVMLIFALCSVWVTLFIVAALGTLRSRERKVSDFVQFFVGVGTG